MHAPVNNIPIQAAKHAYSYSDMYTEHVILFNDEYTLMYM